MNAPSFSDRAMAYLASSYREFDLMSVECRDSASGDGFTFEGVASVVDMPYEVHDQFGTFTETIRAGAFSKSLKDSKTDVALYVNHRHADVPMASTRAKTMTLTADPHLRALASLDSARSDVVIARSAVTRGELPQMSIGFTVNKARDDWNPDFTERIIREVNLMEVSIVRQGANPHTAASMRSIDELLDADASTWSEAEVRRAINHLTSLLAAEEVAEANPFAERDRADRDRLERLCLLR